VHHPALLFGLFRLYSTIICCIWAPQVLKRRAYNDKRIDQIIDHMYTRE
jgi:hypothetical protein